MFKLLSKFFKLKGDYFHVLDWQRSSWLLIIRADKVMKGKALFGSASGVEMPPPYCHGVGEGWQFLSKTFFFYVCLFSNPETLL